MFNRVGLLAISAVLGFGVVGLAQSDPDGSVPWPADSGEAGILQDCWYEYYDECGPWYYFDTWQECTHTWRCGFFVYKGCYQIYYRERICHRWRRWCCQYPPGCTGWEYLGWYVSSQRSHEFLACYCTGVSGGYCTW
jgi:hypothetical protein